MACLLGGLSNPVVEAGCGEYVFDRLHPQVLNYPGLTLYRQTHEPSDVFLASAHHHPTPEVACQWIQAAEEQVGTAGESGNSDLQRYALTPPVCHGPHCQQQPEAPGQMNPPAIATQQQMPVPVATLTTSNLSDPESVQFLALTKEVFFDSQWRQRLYRPPG